VDELYADALAAASREVPLAPSKWILAFVLARARRRPLSQPSSASRLAGTGFPPTTAWISPAMHGQLTLVARHAGKRFGCRAFQESS